MLCAWYCYFLGTQYDPCQGLTAKRPKGKCPQCLYYQRQESAINKTQGGGNNIVVNG